MLSKETEVANQDCERAVLILHAIAGAWLSCVEMPIQRLFLALCAAVQDAPAHAEASGVKTHMRADNARVKWAQPRSPGRGDEERICDRSPAFSPRMSAK